MYTFVKKNMRLNATLNSGSTASKPTNKDFLLIKIQVQAFLFTKLDLLQYSPILIFLTPTQNPGVIPNILSMTLGQLSVTVPEDRCVQLNSPGAVITLNGPIALCTSKPVRMQTKTCNKESEFC